MIHMIGRRCEIGRSIPDFEDCDVADAVRGSLEGRVVDTRLGLVSVDVDPISKVVLGRREDA